MNSATPIQKHGNTPHLRLTTLAFSFLLAFALLPLWATTATAESPAMQDAQAGTFLLDEEHIKSMITAFVVDGKTMMNGFEGDVDYTQVEHPILQLHNDTSGRLYLTIRADKVFQDPTYQIREVNLYVPTRETKDHYGFIRKYEKDDRENRVAHNTVFFGDRLNKQFIAIDDLSDASFQNGINMLLESNYDNREENFYAYFNEATQEYRTAASAIPETFLFDEAYLGNLITAFVKNGETEGDGFINRDLKINTRATSLKLQTSTGAVRILEITTDKRISDAKRKVNRATFYGINRVTNEYYGFAQLYERGKKGKVTVNNIIFFGPLGSDSVTGNDGLSDEDFTRGVDLLMESDYRNMKSNFDAYFEEMDQKYDPQ